MPDFAETVQQAAARALEDAQRAAEHVEDRIDDATSWVDDTVGPVLDDVEETVEDVYEEIGVPPPWEVLDEVREWVRGEVVLLDEVFGDILDELDLPPPPEEEDDDDGWDLGDWVAFGLLAYLLWEFLEWLDGDMDVMSFDVDFVLYTWTSEPPEDGEEEVVEVHRQTFFAPVPFAARLLDPMAHGGLAFPGPGSTDVFIGGRPALRMIDQVACPLPAPVPHTPTVFVPSQTQTLINGMPALRAGDFMPEGLGGPNPIVTGCPTVILGQPVPPVECLQHVASKRKTKAKEWVRWKREIRVKGKVIFGAALDGPYVRFDGDVTDYIYAEGEIPLGDSATYEVDAQMLLGKVHLDAKLFFTWQQVAARRLFPPEKFEYEFSDIEIGPTEIDQHVDVDLPWE